MVAFVAVLAALTTGPSALAGSPAGAPAVSIARVTDVNTDFSARVHFGFDPEKRFTATLNGHNVTGQFEPSIGRTRIAALAPDDGLRHGLDTLRIVGVGSDGHRAQATLRFRISPARPLAAAPDARTVAGHSVSISPRASLRAAGGARLTYRWQLMRGPRGSHARTRTTARGALRFKPRRPGTYRLRLVAATSGRPGSRASDTVIVRATPLMTPIGLPVTMHTTINGHWANKIGADNLLYGGHNVLAAIYDRTTFEQLQVLKLSGSANSANTLSNAISSWQSNKNVAAGVLVFLSTKFGASGIDDAAYNKIIASLGGSAINSSDNVIGWSVIGVPGTSAGTAWEHAYGGYIKGYVQLDNYLHFAFLAPSYGQFATQYQSSSSGGMLNNTMQVSESGFAPTPLYSDQFPAQPLTAPSSCPGAGGFQVVELDGRYLARRAGDVHNKTFFTNSCNANADFQQLTAMNQFLGQAITNQQPDLVLIQSLGKNPHDTSSQLTDQWLAIGAQILTLGGSERIFDELTGPYAFAGGNELPSHAGLPATGFDSTSYLTGSLAYGRDAVYYPASAAANAFADSQLEQIVYQQSTPWPHSSKPGEQDALVYLTQQLDSRYSGPFAGSACYPNNPQSPNLRAEYCDTTITNWGYWAGRVSHLAKTFPSGQGFTSPVWQKVTKEIKYEMGLVPRPLAIAAALAQPFAETSGPNSAEVQNIATRLSHSISPPSSPFTAFLVGLAGDALNAASFLPIEESSFGTATGVLAAAMYLGGDLLATPTGDPALKVTLTAQQLEQNVASMYLDAASEFSHYADIIETDYGKLKAVASSSQFAIGSAQMTALVYSLRLGVAQWAYQTLFRVTYPKLWILPPTSHNGPGTTPQQWVCYAPSEVVFPFHNEPAQGWLSTSSSRYSYPLVLAVGGSWSAPENAPTPSAGLINSAFAAPSDDTNGNPITYGLNRDDFFNDNYGYANPHDAGIDC
jgi:hypothetical protein